jgi:hypothetical protein
VRPSPIIILTPYYQGKVKFIPFYDHVPYLGELVIIFWIANFINGSV